MPTNKEKKLENTFKDLSDKEKSNFLKYVKEYITKNKETIKQNSNEGYKYVLGLIYYFIDRLDNQETIENIKEMLLRFNNLDEKRQKEIIDSVTYYIRLVLSFIPEKECDMNGHQMDDKWKSIEVEDEERSYRNHKEFKTIWYRYCKNCGYREETEEMPEVIRVAQEKEYIRRRTKELEDELSELRKRMTNI